jgi:hypothetical protein
MLSFYHFWICSHTCRLQHRFLHLGQKHTKAGRTGCGMLNGTACCSRRLGYFAPHRGTPSATGCPVRMPHPPNRAYATGTLRTVAYGFGVFFACTGER